MDENHKAALHRFFSIASVVFFVIYLAFMTISLFSFSVSIPFFMSDACSGFSFNYTGYRQHKSR